MTRSRAIVQNAAAQFGTPFFLFDAGLFSRNLTDFLGAFLERYPRTMLAYSFKTNFVPYLCNIVREKGMFAEVVSEMEYRQALALGFTGDRIVLNGPVKDRGLLTEALRAGCIVNLHSPYEVEAIDDYANANPDEAISVGLRVNISLRMADGSSPRQGGREYSRFGFVVEDGTFEQVIRTLRSRPNIRVTGLHGHASTSTRDVAVYTAITTALCDAGATLLRGDLEYINVGGGFFSRLPRQYARPGIPTFDDYAEAISSIVVSRFGTSGPELFVEPGTAVVADCFSYVTEVLDVYRVGEHHYVLVDGSAIHAKPTMHSRSLPIEVIPLAYGDAADLAAFSVVGFTCMEKDVIAECAEGVLPRRGDLIVARNCGAYTIPMIPQFIEVRPPVVVLEEDGGLHPARRRDELTDVFGAYCGLG